MADESVHVHIRVTSDKRQIAETRRELERLAAAGRAADGDFGDLNETLDDHNERHRRLQRNSRGTTSALNANGSAATQLSSKMKKSKKDMDFFDKSRKALEKGLETGLKLALKGAAIEMVGMGLAISSVNGLLSIGSATMKTYKFLMHGLAYAAAAGVAALATFAAAQREYNAAMQAFNYKSMPALGAGVNQSMAALRNLTSDSRVAVFGMQNLNAAFANVSKNAELTKPMQDALAGLGDFAVAAGGDIGKNFAQAAEFVGLLKKQGSLTTDVMAAATKIGPQFEKALKESGKTGADEILALMSSGALAKSAGVEGALGAVNDTLMGQAKAFFTEMQARFADLGQLFLPGAKTAFAQLQEIVRVTFMRISGSVLDFGTGKLLGDIVKVTEKLADLFVNLFDKYMPKSKNLFAGVGDIFDKIKGWWDSFVSGLKKLSGASTIINKSFGPVFRQIFEGLGGSLQMFAKLIQDNEKSFVDFGQALVTAFRGVQDFFNGFKQFFVANLPIIGTLVSGLGTILGLLGKVIGGIAQMKSVFGVNTGPLGALLSLGAVGGLALGINKIAPNSKSKLGRVGGAINRRIGGGTTGGTTGASGMTTAATINTKIVYLNTNKVIDRNRSGQTRPSGGGSSGLNPQGGVGTVPYGPYQPQTRLSRFGSAANRGMGKFMGSPMAQSIGAGVGLAALSQFAGKEADPFIAAGAGIGMINPMAGLAVGGLGTAATAKTAGGGAVSGALGGAAAGALIGTALGGPVVGTAIGAAIGTGFGATMGYIRSQAAERDQARGVAREKVQGTFGTQFAEQLYGKGGPEGARKVIENAAKENDRMQTIFRQFQEVEQSLGGVDVASNKKIVETMRMQGIQLSDEEANLLSTQKHLSAYFSSHQKQTEGLIALGEGPLSHFEDQTKRLAGITGKTQKEMSDLAITMGVDLMDPTKTLADNLKALGLASVKTAAQIQGANREIYVKSFEQIFSKAKEFKESQNALNQAAEGIRQSGKATTSGQVTDFVQTLYEQALTLNKGDASKAVSYMERAIFGGAGRSDQLSGEQFKAISGPLYTLESIFQQSLEGDEQGRTIQEAAYDALLEIKKGINAQVGQNILAAAGGRGLQVAGGDELGVRTAITNQMGVLQAAIDNPYAAAFKDRNQEALLKLQSLGERIAQSPLKGEELSSMVEQELRAAGINTDFMTQGEAQKALEGSAKEMHDAIIEAAKEGIGKSPDWLQTPPIWYDQDNPLWWDQQPTWYKAGPIPPDTTSPRAIGDATSSRLGRTMARHSFFDGGLPGKRTITSGWRNFNLGSLKSDHLTGNAYDLTGQNLVGYANAVNSSGGFAEFHGSGAGRHLHVVPGQTPIGDSVSSMSPVFGSASSGGTYSYTINVYPNPGQDAAAIAQEVMNRIEAKEKSVRERS